MKAQWGLETSGDPKYCWGARAIWTNRVIDIPGDRQTFAGESSPEERHKLASWVNTKGMKSLDRLLSKEYIGVDQNVRVEVLGEGFKLSANPNASFGYLYIVCESVS